MDAVLPAFRGRDRRQDGAGSVSAVVEDRLACLLSVGGSRRAVNGVRVAVPPGKVAGGHGQPQGVSALDDMAYVPGLDREPKIWPGVAVAEPAAYESFAEVLQVPVGMHVAPDGDEVGIGFVGGNGRRLSMSSRRVHDSPIKPSTASVDACSSSRKGPVISKSWSSGAEV
jgi:hypothetical protein